MKTNQPLKDGGIVKLEGVHAVRKRTGMYIGSIEGGVFHIWKEILDNAVDEHLAGRNSKIEIEIDTKRNQIWVRDWGRGIPNTLHSATGLSVITTIFTELHASGKFDKQLYKTSGGLNGVGATVTNALSKNFRVTTWHEGKCFAQEFAQGVPTSKDPKPKTGTQRWSTEVTFVPDAEIFGASSKIPSQQIKEHCRTTSFLCPGLEVVCKVDDIVERFKAKNGISDWLKERTEEAGMKLFSGKVFEYHDAELDVVLGWADGLDGEQIDQYVNTIHTRMGGTPTTALKKAVGQATAKLTKGKITANDMRWGITSIISIRVGEPQFRSQTKDELTNAEVTSQVYGKLVGPLTEWVGKNSALMKILVSRAAKLAQAKEKLEAEKAALQSVVVGNGQRGGMPSKMLVSRCSPEERELFLCEGDSAMGSVKQARDKNFQEALPLRGKITNAAKVGVAALLKNEDVRNIVTAIGAGVGAECDPSKARTKKIILLMDADHDGRHIECLNITLFAHLMRPLLDQGYVYVAVTPLFQASFKDGTKVFGNTMAELKAKVGTRQAHYSRLKGLGEINADDLWDVAMNPATRTLVQIGSTKKSLEQLAKLMGNDAQIRRDLLGI